MGSKPPSSASASTWEPKWQTIADKSKAAKPHLSSTITFSDDWVGFAPSLDDDEQKRLNEQDIHQKEQFLEAFRRMPECKGTTFMRSKPKSADFDMQIFNGLDGRAGKWQWVLYRTDTFERLAFGEEADVNSVAKNVCTALRTHVGLAGGEVE